MRVENQGQGIGSDLLHDALRRVIRAGEDVGIRAVIVDAIDADAARFYRHYGFEGFTDDDLTLMVPMEAVRRLIA